MGFTHILVCVINYSVTTIKSICIGDRQFSLKRIPPKENQVSFQGGNTGFKRCGKSVKCEQEKRDYLQGGRERNLEQRTCSQFCRPAGFFWRGHTSMMWREWKWWAAGSWERRSLENGWDEGTETWGRWFPLRKFLLSGLEWSLLWWSPGGSTHPSSLP